MHPLDNPQALADVLALWNAPYQDYEEGQPVGSDQDLALAVEVIKGIVTQDDKTRAAGELADLLLAAVWLLQNATWAEDTQRVEAAAFLKQNEQVADAAVILAQPGPAVNRLMELEAFTAEKLGTLRVQRGKPAGD